MDDYLFEILVIQIQSWPLYFTNCEKLGEWLNLFLSLPNSKMEVPGSYCATLKGRFNGSGFCQLAFSKSLLIFMLILSTRRVSDLSSKSVQTWSKVI